MRTKKLTTADRVKLILAKDEPEFQTMLELDKMELCHVLNWYAQNQDREHSHRYLSDYCKEKLISATPYQIEKQVATFGFVSRLLLRGAILNDKSMKWFDIHMADMLKLAPEPEKPVVRQLVKMTKEQKEQAQKAEVGRCISDLEHSIDRFIEDGFKTEPDAESVMYSHELTPPQYEEVADFFTHWKQKVSDTLSGLMKDAHAENPSGYTIVQLKKLDAYYNSIIAGAHKLGAGEQKEKKARKKKPRTPETQVKQLKYLAHDTETKLNSIDPKNIIGASSIWTYHVPSRNLTNYIASHDGGFEVKGCAILNYSIDKSKTKKLRKPEQVLPKVIDGGKVALRHLLEELTTKDGKVTGRVNSQTLILRALI